MSLLLNLVRKIIKVKKEKIVIPVYKSVSDPQLLEGKIVMITGGTGGIGIAIARAAVQCGAKVILCGTNDSKLKNFCEEIGNCAKGLRLNLNDCSSLTESFKQALGLFPENRVDVLINAAGLHSDWNILDFDEATFDRIMDVNVKGTYCISQIVAKDMIDKKVKGHILNVSSSSALRPAWTPYQISKWAVNGMTKGFADMLLPYGIVVNAIAPGPTATQMVKSCSDENIFYFEQPSHRYSTPEEIANLAIFMVSSMGNMIVGDTYYITGGSGTISYHR